MAGAQNGGDDGGGGGGGGAATAAAAAAGNGAAAAASANSTVKAEAAEEAERTTTATPPPPRRTPAKNGGSSVALAAALGQQPVEYDGSLLRSTAAVASVRSIIAEEEEEGLALDSATSERVQQQRQRSLRAHEAAAGGAGAAPSSSDGGGRPTIYGVPRSAETRGRFPDAGSTLGPFFCLGQIGKGTFSSVHKCINMAYREETYRRDAEREADSNDNDGAARRSTASSSGKRRPDPPRLVAAKVELAAFAQSGVLDSEATILDFLHRSLPPNTVPVYMGHYRSASAVAPPPSPADARSEAGGPDGGQQPPGVAAAALVMEYLPGEDMNQLRERVTAGGKSRRVALEDAVTLAADVMLPLLRSMHRVGIVHRDVKPSNCVLRSSGDGGVPDFCLVDFGLSKSIVVPEDNPYADRAHYFEGTHWLRPKNYSGRACFRQERKNAEFRGTSMYAGLFVHQLRDYCPRDDMYSLLYVFCDLVSGGLPWMSYAANRDRAKCQELKELVHGIKNPLDDETEWLLQGDEYHLAKYREKERQEKTSNTPSRDLPQPLALSRDSRKVGLLRTAFDHLSKLNFWDLPDYDLIENCIRGFEEGKSLGLPPVPRIDFQVPARLSERWRSNLLGANRNIPKCSLPEDTDPLDEDIFDDFEGDDEESSGTASEGDVLSVLPVELRFRISQMDFHAKRPWCVPDPVALRDWLKVVLPVLYGEWNTRKYEGRFRTSSDGLKRELYLRVLKSCRDWAKKFGGFHALSFHPYLTGGESTRGSSTIISNGVSDGGAKKRSLQATEAGQPESSKRIKATPSSDKGGDTESSYLSMVSQALYGLEESINDEESKKPAAQASRISFS